MKKKDVEAMDLEVKGFLGISVDGNDAQKSAPDEPQNPIEDLLFRDRWGFDRSKADGGNPAPERRPLSHAEIAKSLEALSRTLGKPAFKNTAALVKALAVAAKEHLPEENFTRKFLEGYAAGDKTAMRSAVQKLVAASRDEITAYIKAGGTCPAELLLKGEPELPN
jgi:hypothetical protein